MASNVTDFERVIVEFDAAVPQKVLIVTDSRGKDLDKFLRNKLDSISETDRNFTSHVSIHKGADLRDLLREAKKFEEIRKPDLVVFQGGICNFTRKEVFNGNQTLSYYRGDQIIEFLTTVKEIREEYGNSALIATVVPASLIKYFEVKNGSSPHEELLESLNQQQIELLEDIEYVNSQIIAGNKQIGTRTIDLHDKVFVTSIKKYKNKSKSRKHRKFENKNLFDGVHPNETLSLILNERTYDSIVKYLDQCRDVQIELNTSKDSVDSQNSQTDTDSWNFKRQVKL